MIFPGESEATEGTPDPKIDVGLLALRIGLGFSFVLLFVLIQADGARIFILHPGRLWPLVGLSIAALLVVCGFLTELASALSVLSWAWALYSGLQAGDQWFVLPFRAALYVILFAALAITGPGKFSLDYVLWSKTGREPQ
ncbi:MAG: hypothetical protein LAO31_22655 [Acidobacteriia bacterium]|nr:hypothetical protein [Terriglobia bacterium]